MDIFSLMNELNMKLQFFLFLVKKKHVESLKVCVFIKCAFTHSSELENEQSRMIQIKYFVA